MLTTQSGSQKARDTLAYLRSRISSGEWPVGSPIPKEPELMELIGVGKSTVREAVRSLATLGMLKTVPGVGTFVQSRTPVSSILTAFLADQDLEEVLVYRRSLEIEAAQTAAVKRSDEQLAALRASYEASIDGSGTGDACPERCDDTTRPGSFHRLIVEASGSRLLLDLYTGVMAVLRDASLAGKVFLGTSRETMNHDHAALLAAIAGRDVRDAAHTMALHADRDLGLHADMLDLSPHTERAETLIEAGYDPSAGESPPDA
ncbi:FadR/GntR family transcriptional regulator [Leucobacter luti]|uniref:FadR/GntR family transcriptional regulator n=1 Tax=Leucobacter luti TaxID=340320 RepID=UPI003D018DF9